MYEEEWYALLPPEFMQHVYRCQNELAWPRDQALHIIDWLTVNDYVVKGIQTWFPTFPGPSPLIDDWRSDRVHPSPPFPMSARAFVAAFNTIPTFLATPRNAKTQKLDPVFNISADKN